ncbi:LysR family transcriptional regulator [Pseudomonas citronellolis]|uniref:LysR family transcriptional regulator n=1 Tax=Pseudomonas citronellolis TaxID=53408 RepID=UPI0023E379B4|nr:LysR family transcriptional regulator [Pseudomonas citronellolis]MDF3936583.1 LysR family transcriptional regulator [Pseudomonas citronellolis]
MDRLEAMSIFLAAVDAGSLSAAGRRLGVPLSSVSRKVAELEEHLGARLLIRSTRRLQLTEAGRAYLAACRQILDAVGDAERAAAGEYQAPRGTLVVTAPLLFGRLHLQPLVLEFLRAYPQIDVQLLLADSRLHLLEEHVDLALRIGPLPDSSFVARQVGAVRRVVCASPAYLAEHGEPQAPEDLAGHSCVSFVGLETASAWTFPGAREVAIRARLSVSSAEAAVDAAVAGLGITRVLSYQAERELRAGRLLRLLKDFEPDPWPINLLHAGQGAPPLKLRAFLDYLAPRLRERLGS